MPIINQGSLDEFQAVSSRVGFNWTYKTNKKGQFNAVVEYGMDPINSGDDALIYPQNQKPSGSSGDSFWNRLGLITYSHESYGSITIGKTWGVYYDVVGKTDLFTFSGGTALGAYNFGSDGGGSGTGRADGAIQYRSSYGNLSLGIQYQAQEKDIDFEDDADIDDPIVNRLLLENNAGISLLYSFDNEIEIGFAYNYADIEAEEGAFPTTDGVEDEVVAVSISYGDLNDVGFLHKKAGLYWALGAYQGENHEIDNLGYIFDSKGIEGIVVYNFENNISVYGGFNRLEEDDDKYQQAYLARTGKKSEYELEYIIAGVKYIYGDNVRVWAEYRNSSSTMADGTDEDDAFGLGVRMYFF